MERKEEGVGGVVVVIYSGGWLSMTNRNPYPQNDFWKATVFQSFRSVTFGNQTSWPLVGNWSICPP